jgi:cystathionine beta-synthase
MVCGVGSGGTITGLSQYFAEHKPSVEMVLADPVGSVLADYVQTGKVGEAGSWLVEGIGEDFVPPIADLSRVREAFRITDRESMSTARKLLKDEGVFAGSSSGTLVAAAVKYCQQQVEPKVVVTLICDSGAKYLSKVHNESWLAEAGMIDVKRFGDIRDLISHKTADGEIISLAPDDLLSTAYARMRLYDVSQLPVLADRKLAGIIDESDLLLATRNDPNSFGTPVAQTMTSKIETLPRFASVHDVLKVLDRGLIAVISDELGFHGLITRVDALNHLRQQKDHR